MNFESNVMRRRDFVKGALALAGGVGTLHAAQRRSIRGANDDIRLGIIGIGRKGPQHIEVFNELSGVRIAALCDCDTRHLDPAVAGLKKRGLQISRYVDFRNMLDDKDIDAVVIATPDHWHALMTVMACQAGKDVYVEKPACHNLWEGRKMVEAARKYNRIVAVGSQNRSDIGLLEAVPYIRAGNLGDVRMARAFMFSRRQGMNRVLGPQPIPSSCNYDLFQGPAPMAPLMREQLHYDWHWFWETGTGEMGNLGAHHLDHSRWVMGQETIAPAGIMMGGRFNYDDDGQTPNTHIAYFDYKPFPLIYELRSLPRKKGDPVRDTYRGLRTTLRLECEGGFFAGGRGGGWAYDNNGKKIRQFPGDGGAGHQANFIDALRSRRKDDLRAEVLEGHISAALCHMANISYRLAHRMSAESVSKAVSDNVVLAESVDRMFSHLRANEIDLDANPFRIGPMLHFDINEEQFTGNQSQYANMFLKRLYRPPFVMPDTV